VQGFVLTVMITTTMTMNDDEDAGDNDGNDDGGDYGDYGDDCRSPDSHHGQTITESVSQESPTPSIM